MQTSQPSGAPRVQSVQCCVVFDPADGEIKHIHDVVTFEGGEAVSDYEVEQRALSLAAERGLDSSRLKAIHVDPAELEPARRYAVDPDRSALVPRSEPPQ
jgi:hypothetical protein